MSAGMNTVAVVLEGPERLALSRVALSPPGEDDLVVDIEWSGISTGTERLLWSGRMPHFPGMGYPLVPGYESVGRIREVGARAGRMRAGERVFVPGARCFGNIRGLFGGAAAQLVVPAAKVVPVHEDLGDRAVLLARLAVLGGGTPTIWERNAVRAGGAEGYRVCDPADDARRDYRAIYDVSGDASLLDELIGRLAPGGEIVLAGFYVEPLSFAFAPAFMREARIRVAAEGREPDLAAVSALAESGELSLDGLITHRCDASEADGAYRTAFGDPACLKMILDWRKTS